MSSVVYLDNNATTAVDPLVLEAMLPYLQGSYGNPSSIHRFGGMIKRDIDRARQQVAELIHAKPTEIIFTGSGSESDNCAIQGFCSHHGSGPSRLLTSTVEHSAVRNCCRFLQKRGVSLYEIGVGHDGLLSMETLADAPMDQHTLATFMWANNETGVLFPIPEIVEKVKQNGGIVHTDAVQAVGKIPIDVSSCPVDMLTLSGHKIHGPKGIGALFIRENVKIDPLIHGGHHERGLRAGTENVASIVGLGVACERAARTLSIEQSRVRQLRDRLEQALLARCAGAKLNGHPQHRLPNTTNISFEFIEGESILLLLDEHDIAASSGSACTTGSLEPSHVMLAMGVPYTYAHSSIRFSLSMHTTEAQIDLVIQLMPEIVNQLRKISPYVQ
ncbi:MAG: cysteine desulfurase NifS [Chitinivibrionales bacterium]|nr:cysteine desulfurase NifS [Chitinivibrionales bacterium]